MGYEKNSQLEDLKEIKQNWTKKLNSLRKQESSISDVGQLHSIREEMANCEKKIEKCAKEILEIETQTKSNPTPAAKIEVPHIEKALETDIEDVAQAIEVLRLETRNLNYNSTKEDIAKIHSLKTKIFEEVFNSVNSQLDFVTARQELMYSSVLFNTIYSSPVLDIITEESIQRIRHDGNNYTLQDRSIIVSALSLSLINHKFDVKKANLLLDFLTDFESKIWQRALTGLVIAIIYQKNRSWLKSDGFVRRLKTLQNNDEVQEGLKIIDFILKNELYKANLINPNIFKIDLFKQPVNYFVPFYENNQVLIQALQNAPSDFDTDDFREYLDKMPILDTHKYALCTSLSSEGLTKKKLKKHHADVIMQSLSLSIEFSPFQNLITEFYCFFNFYPEKLKDDVFNKQLIIVQTELKKYVLNKLMQLLLEGNTAYHKKDYKTAIRKCLEILKIDQSNMDARWQLGNCYIKNREPKKSLETFLEIEKMSSSDRRLKFKIAACYQEVGNFEKSNEYCEMIESESKDPSFNLLCIKSENYEELGDFDSSLKYCIKAEAKCANEEDIVDVAVLYYSIEKNDDALRLIKLALETKKPKYFDYISLANIYINLSDWDNALIAIDKAEELDNKDEYSKVARGRVYLFSKKDLKKAENLFNQVIKSKSDVIAIAHGNLGHLHLISGNSDGSIRHYTECIKLLDNVNEFDKKMTKDLSYMLALNISLEQYDQIKNECIENYSRS